MADIRRAAQALYQMLIQESVEESLLTEAADFFAGTDSPIDPSTFRIWFRQIQGNLHQQQDLLPLARRWRERMEGRTEFSLEEAEELHREYVTALHMDRLAITGVVAGFSKRSSGSPFDYELTQPNGATAWVLMYTVEGRARLRAGIRETETCPGDALLFSPEAVYSISRSVESDHWSHYWVMFQPLTRWRHFLDWPEVAPSTFCVRAEGASGRSIHEALDSLQAACASPSPYKVELESNRMENLLLCCASLQHSAQKPVVDVRILNAQKFIEDHYRQDFTLQQVADAAHLSGSRLAGLFKEQTGLSVFGWRDEKRLVEAAQLLRGTDLSVAEVGRRVGIADAAYFSRLFRRYVGTSPREYRRGEPQGLATDAPLSIR